MKSDFINDDGKLTELGTITLVFFVISCLNHSFRVFDEIINDKDLDIKKCQEESR